MTTKATEAGARAILERTKVTSLDDADGLATLVIEAAIASGELVPASAVAAERERCAAIAANVENRCLQDSQNPDLTLVQRRVSSAQAFVASEIVAAMSNNPLSFGDRDACLQIANTAAAQMIKIGNEKPEGPSRDHYYARAAEAINIAAAIRALSPEPASGEFVVVPRKPTEAMIEAGEDTFMSGHSIEVWTAMLTAATKDGERA